MTQPPDDALRAIGLVVFDFDGVFTDNRVWVNERGEESVACWRGDGIGLRRLDEVGVPYVIVSTEPNPVGRAAGGEAAGALRPRRRRQAGASSAPRRTPRASRSSDVAYVGNDVNDATCLEAVGLPVVPADAWPEVVPLARLGARTAGRARLRARALRRRVASRLADGEVRRLDYDRAVTDPLFDLSGRVAVVTGGSGSSGRELAVALAARGMRVAILDRATEPRRASASGSTTARPRAHVRRDRPRRRRGGARARRGDWGVPHLLVNAAAIDAPPDAPAAEVGPFEDVPLELARARRRTSTSSASSSRAR